MIKRPLLSVLAGVGGFAAAIVVYGFVYALVPPSDQSVSKTVTLPRGLTFRQIAQTLERDGIISGVHRFVLLGRILKAGPRAKAGEYTFDLPLSHWSILKTIIQGRVKTYNITIPEGYTLSQIGDLLEKKGILSKESFIRKASSFENFSHYQLEGPNLEGYLFPDTYAWSKETEPEIVIRFFLDRFRRVFTPEITKRAHEIGFSEREILTIASIIEKETSDPRERPLVSAVIHNRLRRGIPLQSDPTVIYGIPDFNGNLTKKDLSRYTPFNTYIITGLPPGPIANPGIDSIRAALYPARVDYLFFVSKNDGTHHFSSTLEEHNAAVDRYQRHKDR